jgi:hypothetical protein
VNFGDVSIGDFVVVDPPSRGACRKICQVEKVTATQFTAGGYRFNKRNGWQIGGDSYYAATVKTATPELIKQVELEQRYSNAQARLRQKLNTLETLWREIDRNHDSHQWAATLEKALPHLTAAVEALKVRQEEAQP